MINTVMLYATGNYAVVSVCARFRPNNLSAESTQAKAEQVCDPCFLIGKNLKMKLSKNEAQTMNSISPITIRHRL